MPSRLFRASALAVAIASGFAAPRAVAQPATQPATQPAIVRSRIEALREVGTAFKNINDELKSRTPQLFIVQLSARQIRDAARNQYGWFPAGSGPQPGAKTRAKPEIWARPTEFKTAQDAFAGQATAFFQIAAAGDVAKIRAQANKLGQACSNCHRTFRVEDED